MPGSNATRAPEAGVTLVEVLVVLVIVGVLAGAVALSVGQGTRQADAADLARQLAARLERAGAITEITGRPSALIWNTESYRFVSLEGAAWVPHATALLARTERLPTGVRLAAADPERGAAHHYVLTPAALPVDGAAPLELIFWSANDSAPWLVAHNGATGTARPMQEVGG